MTNTIGIDLGTSSSTAAIYDDGRPRILTTIPDEHFTSQSLTSSNHQGRPLPGATNSAGALSPALQFLGRSFDDAIVQLAREHVTFDVHRGADDGILVTAATRTQAITVDELVTKTLRRLKERSESYLGAHIAHAVLAIPAHFDGDQRRAVRHAAQKAGFTALQLIDAPTAASLAFAHRYKDQERKLLLVADLDKGHFDLALLRLEGMTATLLAHEGSATLGHVTWAARIADSFAQGFLRKHGIDLRRHTQARLRLHMAAEEASAHLLEADEAAVDLPFIASGAQGPHHLNMILTRQMYNAQTAALRARLEQAIASVLREASVEPGLIDNVLLLGRGAAQVALREAVRNRLPEAPLIEDTRRELVALGAALQAMRSGTDEGPATGQDVTRLGLGLETVGGLMTTMIPRNTLLPARRVELFSTSEDGQTDIEITVLQGERPLAADNRRLGIVRVQGIPEAPRGTPQIEVTFEVGTEGILQVTARDLATEVSESYSVEINETIRDGEAQQLVEEAQANEADDLRKRTLVETENLGRQTVYQMKRYLQHLNGVGGRKGCEGARREVEGKLQALQEAVAVQDVQKIQDLTDELQAASNILNNLAYGQATAMNADPDGRATERELDELEASIEEL